MSATNLLLSTALLGVVAWVATKLLQQYGGSKSSLPLPPGPKPKPLVGNLADMPPPGGMDWEHWGRHKELYGPISSVTTFGTTIVLLNAHKAAVDLLHQRSAIYSGRPRLVFLGEMCGWKDIVSLRHYDSYVRATRKFLHGAVGTNAALARYPELQETEVRRFLLRTLERPAEFRDHMRKVAGAIVLKLAYGYEIEPHKEDPLVKLADEVVDQFSKSALAGARLVDMVPILRHLPDWMPGTSFKRTAKAWKANLDALVQKPPDFVRRQMAAMCNEPSVLSLAYEKSPNMDADQEHIVKYAAAALYAGGADTTVSTLATFFVVMTLYPEVQRRAQDEIDQVIGTGRLPTVADRDRLPYVSAVVSEALRFHPIAPMGVAHLNTTEDVYEGYRIPKGAIVMANLWLYSRDESVYPDPETFNPERFLGPDPAPYPAFVFGFGRRVCPGRLLAEQSVWLTVASSLAVFDISSSSSSSSSSSLAAGGAGTATATASATNAKTTRELFLSGAVSHPAPFEARIRPRTPAHEALIRDLERSHPWRESHAKDLEGIKV